MPSTKAHIMNCEYDCAEESQILVVKRAIDKDVLIKVDWDSLGLRFRHVRMLGSIAGTWFTYECLEERFELVFGF
jgi:hypothetical protein